MGITEFIASWGTRVIGATGYAGVFFLMVAESMILPIPSEAVMPFAGFLVAEGSMSAAVTVGLATLGSFVGSILSYFIGRYGGRALVVRYGKTLLVSERDLASADRFFRRHGAITVFIARFIPVVRHVISIPAGVAKMRLFPFSSFTVVGATLWNGFLVACGVALRRNWEMVLRYSKWVDILVLVLLVGLVTLFLVRHLRRRVD